MATSLSWAQYYLRCRLWHLPQFSNVISAMSCISSSRTCSTSTSLHIYASTQTCCAIPHSSHLRFFVRPPDHHPPEPSSLTSSQLPVIHHSAVRHFPTRSLFPRYYPTTRSTTPFPPRRDTCTCINSHPCRASLPHIPYHRLALRFVSVDAFTFCTRS